MNSCLWFAHDLVGARQGSGGFDGCIVKRAATQDFCAGPFEDARSRVTGDQPWRVASWASCTREVKPSLV